MISEESRGLYRSARLATKMNTTLQPPELPKEMATTPKPADFSLVLGEPKSFSDKWESSRWMRRKPWTATPPVQQTFPA